MAKPHGSYAKLSKRLRQLGYLCGHPLDHFRCAAAIRRSRLAANPRVTLKYLGDHLALSLRPAQRRMALESHYEIMSGMLRQGSAGALGDGLLIWRKGLSDGQALSITLEPSKLAPMEGELQLRFSFRSDLCVLTFLIAHGEIFGVHQRTILFVGGVQGRVGARQEFREASKHNAEISPSAMLFLAVQAIARVMGVGEIIGIGEDDQISTAYSRPRIRFDYHRFWTGLGGLRQGAHYSIPLETPSKPILETSPSHRSRTRRKREAKWLLRQSIERHVAQYVNVQMAVPA
jgi:uncharacterized protein VirK/YbjX